MRRSLLICLLLLVVSFAHADDVPAHVWVVSIGVGRYTRNYAALVKAPEGARAVTEALAEAQPGVTTAFTLTTDDPEAIHFPTVENVGDAFDTLATKVRPADRVIVYFAGHGVEYDGVPYFLLMNIATTSNKEALERGALSVAWLRKKLNGLNCRERLLWLDACRVNALTTNGAGQDEQQPQTATAMQAARLEAGVTLHGCNSGQRVYYSKDGPSFFTSALVDGLRGQATDARGQVTMSSLARYVQQRVPARLKEEYPDITQIPILDPAQVPDTEFVLRPARRIAVPAFSGRYGALFATTTQTCLIASHEVALVERMKLEVALKELHFETTGITEANAKELGHYLNAQYILVGETTDAPGNQLLLSAHLVEVDTGHLPGVAVDCQIDPNDAHWKSAIDTFSNQLLVALRKAGLTVGSLNNVERSQKPSEQHIVQPILPKDVPNTRINPKDGAEMILIPAGEFLMGSTDEQLDAWIGAYPNERKEMYPGEVPQHTVYLDAYYIYKNDVTVVQYRKFCDATGRAMPTAPKWDWQDNHPVVNVTWEDAKAYADWAGAALPTEAQWEKAARGGEGRVFPWGNDWDAGKCSNSVGGLEPIKTSPVGSFATGASPYGVLDMAGNVWQWCSDWYDENYYRNSPARNPLGPDNGTSRVLRGGGWDLSDPGYFRAALRYGFNPSIRHTYGFGFRCACVVP